MKYLNMKNKDNIIKMKNNKSNINIKNYENKNN